MRVVMRLGKKNLNSADTTFQTGGKQLFRSDWEKFVLGIAEGESA